MHKQSIIAKQKVKLPILSNGINKFVRKFVCNAHILGGCMYCSEPKDKDDNESMHSDGAARRELFCRQHSLPNQFCFCAVTQR